MGRGKAPPERKQGLLLFFPKLQQDRLQNAFRICQHVVVPEPNYPATEFIQYSRTLGIGISLIRVLPTVHFDDQSSSDTSEVGHIGADGYLSAKMITIELVAAQSAPEPYFRVGLALAKVARLIE